MAIKTYPVLIRCGASQGALTALPGARSYSDIGGANEQLDTTNMLNSMKTSIPGIGESNPIEIAFNYTKADYSTVNDASGTHQLYNVRYGEAGADGDYYFWGQHVQPWIVGGGVNEVVEMRTSVFPASEILEGSVPDDPTNPTLSDVVTITSTNPAVVTAVDHGTEDITVAAATTVAGLIAAIDSTDGSAQTYAVTEVDGVTGKTGATALVSTDILHVTAEDSSQGTYDITVSA